jgi:hypothetical protein
MKKLFLVFLFVIHSFALGGMDSLPEDQRGVAKSIQDVLALSKNDAYKVYKKYVQMYLEDQHWQVHWFDNGNPAKGKMTKSPQKTMFLSIINDNRLVNISIFKFPKEHQLLVYTIQTIPAKSSLVLKKFEQLKNDKEYEKRRETARFAYFRSKEYMSRVNIYVEPPVGAIQYVDLSVFTLNK